METDDGPVPVDDATAEMIACDSGLIDPDQRDHEADRRISPAKRRRVLARDKNRCRHCDGRHRLQVHHVIPWSEGGRSAMSNLITLCRSCHALVHAELLRVTGRASNTRFEDKRGDLHGPGARPADFLPGAPMITITQPAVPRVELQDVPSRIDQTWWRRHAHLIQWSTRRGSFELTPGYPNNESDRPQGGTTCREESGTVCQPRPDRLDELIGQKPVVKALKTAVEAAKITGEAASHVLLTGPPGLGKTTMARAVASELGVRLHASGGPFVGSMQMLLRTLVDLEPRDVLFLDEIHALPPGVAEAVYEAVEDRQVSLILSSGARARCITLELAPFTLIGATTDAGLLPVAFLQRFIYRHLLDFYEPRQLAVILGRAAACFGVEIEPEAAAELAEVSRGTPRHGISLLRRLRDEAVVGGRPAITVGHVAKSLDELNVDGRGLGPLDRRYLDILASREHPMGLGQLALRLGVDTAMLEREVEPYLMHLGLVAVTPKGRVLARPVSL